MLSFKLVNDCNILNYYNNFGYEPFVKCILHEKMVTLNYKESVVLFINYLYNNNVFLVRRVDPIYCHCSIINYL